MCSGSMSRVGEPRCAWGMGVYEANQLLTASDRIATAEMDNSKKQVMTVVLHMQDAKLHARLRRVKPSIMHE